MNERVAAMQQLHVHAVVAKQEIEAVLDVLGWPQDQALSRALDRLNELKEQAMEAEPMTKKTFVKRNSEGVELGPNGYVLCTVCGAEAHGISRETRAEYAKCELHRDKQSHQEVSHGDKI